jgi:pimeloyl-ACP methyl ester carboxylesterase
MIHNIKERSELMKKLTKHILLVTLIGFLVSFTNKLIFIFSTLNNKLYNSNAQYYDWKFGKIHYTVSGTGTPLLLIHSLETGASSYEFIKLAESLSKQYKLYTIDLLGYGKSEKPKITYTAYLYVQLLSDFIKDIIQEPTNIMTSGKSNAYITMLSYQDSALINNMIFINPASISSLSKNPRTKHVILKYLIELPIIGTLIYNIISSKGFIRSNFKKHLQYNDNNHIGKFVDAYFEASHLYESSNKYVYTSNYCHYNNVNICQALNQINNNIYIIQGRNRTENYDKIAQRYKYENPSIESSIIKSTKDYPHIENPEAVFELLTVYLH